MSSISSNDVELVDALLLQGLNHFRSIKATPGGTEDGSAKILDSFYFLRRHLLPVLGEFLVEASVAPADAPDLLDSVLVLQALHDGLNDHIQAGAESSTSDYGCLDLVSFVNHLLPRSSSKEFVAGLELDDVPEVLLLDDKGVVLDEGLLGHLEVHSRGDRLFLQVGLLLGIGRLLLLLVRMGEEGRWIGLYLVRKQFLNFVYPAEVDLGSLKGVAHSVLLLGDLTSPVGHLKQLGELVILLVDESVLLFQDLLLNFRVHLVGLGVSSLRALLLLALRGLEGTLLLVEELLLGVDSGCSDSHTQSHQG
mmetsp:Transcript_1083/g.1997  ORF Transcript_1083/g.1997 Transcript_1083/m.1997 type:complete len:308 (+) Transcript_1083:1003-1926(+)